MKEHECFLIRQSEPLLRILSTNRRAAVATISPFDFCSTGCTFRRAIRVYPSFYSSFARVYLSCAPGTLKLIRKRSQPETNTAHMMHFAADQTTEQSPRYTLSARKSIFVSPRSCTICVKKKKMRTRASRLWISSSFHRRGMIRRKAF